MFRCSVFYEMGMECDSQEEKAELWQAIMEYGLFGTEPPSKFKRDFVNIRFILEKNKTLKQKRSEAWKKHSWNQYTKWDSKREAQKKPVEQMEQDGTNGTNKNKKENKNIKENNKRKFLEFVELSDEEYTKLIQDYWKARTDDFIARLNDYIGSSWKKYKSHYFTLLNFMRRDGVKKIEKQEAPKEVNLHIDTRASWMKQAFPLNS